MRKKTCLFMLLLSLVCLCAISIGQADTGFELFTTDQLYTVYGTTNLRIRQTVCDGDVVYAYLSDSSICAWSSQSNEFTSVCSLPELPSYNSESYRDLSDVQQQKWKNTVNFLYIQDGSVYGINVFTGEVGIVDVEGIHWLNKYLDLSLLFPDNYSWPLRLVNSLVYNNSLYLFAAFDDMDYPHNNYMLLCCDLDTGASHEIEIQDAQGLCQMNTGVICMLYYNGSAWEFREMDLNTNEIVPTDYDTFPMTFDRTIGGMAYDEITDMLYCISDGTIYTLTEGKSKLPYATIPISYTSGESVAYYIPRAGYAYLDDALIVQQGMDMSTVDSLHLCGCMDEEILRSFMAVYPETSVTFDDSILSPDEIILRLVTQDSTADLYATCVDSSFLNLVRRGYAYPLSQSTKINNSIEEMYPNIRKALLNEAGEPIAYPYQIYLCNWKVNITYWRAIFGDRPLPSTFDDFFEVMYQWEEKYKFDYPNVSFAGTFNFIHWVQLILNAFEEQYAIYIDGELTPASTDNHKLMEILRKIERIRVEFGEDESEDVFAQTELFITDGFNPILQEPPDEKLTLLSVDELEEGIYIDMPPLTFEEGEQVDLSGQMYVWFVNPFSQHRDLAIAYLEFASMIDCNPAIHYGTHPQENTPLPDETYMRQYQQLNEYQIELNDLKQVPDAEIESIDDSLRDVNLKLNAVKNKIWRISEKSISYYRRIASSINFYEDNPYVMLPGRKSNMATEVSTLFEQYRYDKIDTDAFLHAFEKRIEMYILESKNH